MPDLENQIKSMRVGELKSITLGPMQAFGEPDLKLLKETRLSKLPENQRKIGAILDLEDTQGRICSARVHAIEGNLITLDFNHPLAGQTVTFEVELIAIDD